MFTVIGLIIMVTYCVVLSIWYRRWARERKVMRAKAEFTPRDDILERLRSQPVEDVEALDERAAAVELELAEFLVDPVAGAGGSDTSEPQLAEFLADPDVGSGGSDTSVSDADVDLERMETAQLASVTNPCFRGSVVTRAIRAGTMTASADHLLGVLEELESLDMSEWSQVTLDAPEFKECVTILSENCDPGHLKARLATLRVHLETEGATDWIANEFMALLTDTLTFTSDAATAVVQIMRSACLLHIASGLEVTDELRVRVGNLPVNQTGAGMGVVEYHDRLRSHISGLRRVHRPSLIGYKR